MKYDKNYLYNAYNATSEGDEQGELETYENWLERQLISRLETIDELEKNDPITEELLFQLGFYFEGATHEDEFHYNEYSYDKACVGISVFIYYYENGDITTDATLEGNTLQKVNEKELKMILSLFEEEKDIDISACFGDERPCPECLEVVTSHELQTFGGICEQCSEDILED